MTQENTDMMNAAETAFFTRMSQEPKEVRDAFRSTLSLMMGCFGMDAPDRMVVLHVSDAGPGQVALAISAANADREEARAIVAHAADVMGAHVRGVNTIDGEDVQVH